MSFVQTPRAQSLCHYPYHIRASRLSSPGPRRRRPGILLKDRPAGELAEAVCRVQAGLRAIDPVLAAEAWSGDKDPLTEARQRRLPLSFTSPKVQCGTISLKPSPSLAPPIALMLPGSLGAEAGCRE